MKTMIAILLLALPCWAGPQDKKAAGPVDLIPKAELGDPKSPTGWKKAGNTLIGMAAVPEKELVSFDYSPTEDYDLLFTLERMDAEKNDFAVGVIAGDHACAFHFDAYDATKGMLGLISLREYSDYADGQVFKKGKSRTVKMMVRKTTLEILVDGKKYFKSKPLDWTDATVGPKVNVPEKGKLFMWATSGTWRLSACSVSTPAGAK